MHSHSGCAISARSQGLLEGASAFLSAHTGGWTASPHQRPILGLWNMTRPARRVAGFKTVVENRQRINIYNGSFVA